MSRASNAAKRKRARKPKRNRIARLIWDVRFLCKYSHDRHNWAWLAGVNGQHPLRVPPKRLTRGIDAARFRMRGYPRFVFGHPLARRLFAIDRAPRPL